MDYFSEKLISSNIERKKIHFFILVKKYMNLNGKQIEVKKALSRSEINNSRMGGPGFGKTALVLFFSII